MVKLEQAEMLNPGSAEEEEDKISVLSQTMIKIFAVSLLVHLES